MKQQLSEIKKLQQLAGLLKEDKDFDLSDDTFDHLHHTEIVPILQKLSDAAKKNNHNESEDEKLIMQAAEKIDQAIQLYNQLSGG